MIRGVVMKMGKSVGVLLLLGSASMANAEVHTKGAYLGLGFGFVDVGGIEADITEVSGNQGNLVLGYSFGQFSIEFEHARGEADGGEINERRSLLGGWISTDTVDVKSKASLYGLYGVYRTSGKFYFKARLGISHNDIDTSIEKASRTLSSNSASSFSVGDSSFELSFGAGAGYRFKAISIELEYIKVGSDISYANLLSLKYHF